MRRLFDIPVADTGIDSDHIISSVGFWSAVCLPFVQLSLLAGGLDSRRGLTVLGFLFGLNVLALVVGHQHGRE